MKTNTIANHLLIQVLHPLKLLKCLNFQIYLRYKRGLDKSYAERWAIFPQERISDVTIRMNKDIWIALVAAMDLTNALTAKNGNGATGMNKMVQKTTLF